jgi:hypothetical protein
MISYGTAALKLSDRYLVRYIKRQLELFESFAQDMLVSPMQRDNAFELANNGQPTLW